MGTGTVNQSGNSSTVIDPWNLHAAYGPQSFDYKFVFNTSLLYQSPFFKTQKGVLGRVLGGWSQISVTTASNSNAQSFCEALTAFHRTQVRWVYWIAPGSSPNKKLSLRQARVGPSSCLRVMQAETALVRRF